VFPLKSKKDDWPSFGLNFGFAHRSNYSPHPPLHLPLPAVVRLTTAGLRLPLLLVFDALRGKAAIDAAELSSRCRRESAESTPRNAYGFHRIVPSVKHLGVWQELRS
jgi:hypothetical protein